MTWIIVAAGLLGVAYLAFSRIGMQPARYRRQRREDLLAFLNHWAAYGGNGAVLIIEHEKSERFVEFAKSRRPGGAWDLSFAFPDAPWSRSCYPKVCEALDLQGFGLEEIETGERPTTRFLRVSGLAGVPEALVVLDAALEGLELGPEATYVVQFAGPYDVRRAHEDWTRRLHA